MNIYVYEKTIIVCLDIITFLTLSINIHTTHKQDKYPDDQEKIKRAERGY